MILIKINKLCLYDRDFCIWNILNFTVYKFYIYCLDGKFKYVNKIYFYF